MFYQIYGKYIKCNKVTSHLESASDILDPHLAHNYIVILNRWTSTVGLAIPITSAAPHLNYILSHDRAGRCSESYIFLLLLLKIKMSPTILLNVTGD